MAVNSECYLKYKYSIAVLHLISICHLLMTADRIGELKDAMLKHESIEKAKRIYRKQQRARDNDVDDAAEQYCEFMCIKVKSADFSARLASLSPGGKVDLFWHVHLLDTRGYM